MKKILVVAVLAVATQIVSAQISKGTWLLGGHISVSSEKFSEPPENKSTSFNFDPNVGYFFIDQFAGGVRGSIYTEKDKPSDNKYSGVNIGPFLRYYFLEPGKKTNVFLDGSFMFGSDKYTPGGGGTSSTDKSSTFGFMAGPAIFLSDNVALEAALAYYSYKQKDAIGRWNSFGVNVGFQIHLNCADKNTSKK